jgi:secondary thiamine-phosphate synthase enzyme
VKRRQLSIVTGGRGVHDITAECEGFAAGEPDGLLSVFVPHATAGLALIETGSGSEADLLETIDRLLPRDDRWAHRHGSRGHGADHVLPLLAAPSLVVPVVGGRLALGTWQSIVLVETNREKAARTVILSLVVG